MHPQIACLKECKVTLTVFFLLFSSVRFQMSPQIACLKGCKVTMVAFFQLFTLCVMKYFNWVSKGMRSHTDCICGTFLHYVFQVCPLKLLILKRCKVTLIAFSKKKSGFQMFLKLLVQRGYKVTLAAFVWFFSTMCFKFVFKSAEINLNTEQNLSSYGLNTMVYQNVKKLSESLCLLI